MLNKIEKLELYLTMKKSSLSLEIYRSIYISRILSRPQFAFLGDAVVKPVWGKDQPNNYNGEQNCVVLDGGRGWQWNDVGCNLDYLHWVCQHREYHLLISL